MEGLFSFPLELDRLMLNLLVAVQKKYLKATYPVQSATMTCQPSSSVNTDEEVEDLFDYTKMNKQQTHQEYGFLKLPGELRNKILRFSMPRRIQIPQTYQASLVPLLNVRPREPYRPSLGSRIQLFIECLFTYFNRHPLAPSILMKRATKAAWPDCLPSVFKPGIPPQSETKKCYM